MLPSSPSPPSPPAMSPFKPLIDYMSQHKEYPPLAVYINTLKSSQSDWALDDWGLFINPDNIDDYRIHYLKFTLSNLKLVTTLKELSDYPHDGETFCKSIPNLMT